MGRYSFADGRRTLRTYEPGHFVIVLGAYAAACGAVTIGGVGDVHATGKMKRNNRNGKTLVYKSFVVSFISFLCSQSVCVCSIVFVCAESSVLQFLFWEEKSHDDGEEEEEVERLRQGREEKSSDKRK